METIDIHPLKIKASRICLGTWAIGGWMWGGTAEEDAIQTIRYALDNGINIIDTAPVYGFGKAEEIVGKALGQYGNREKIIIATKVGLDWTNGKLSRDSSPKRLRKEIEDSLRRMQTDYVDIYQIHWPDPKVPVEETAAEMLALLNEGKIRAIGVSNYSVAQMESFMKVAPIHTSQPPLNLFERKIEQDILPFTEKHNIISLCSGSLCRGLLTGKMRLDTVFTGDDIRRVDPKFKAPRFEQYLNAVNALNELAKHKYGKNVLALAVRWILDKGHTIALWGARHPEQLGEMNEVMGWDIDMEDMKLIDTILTDHIKSPLGSEFMAPLNK